MRTVKVKMQNQKNRDKIAIGVQNRDKNAIAPTSFDDVKFLGNHEMKLSTSNDLINHVSCDSKL